MKEADERGVRDWWPGQAHGRPNNHDGSWGEVWCILESLRMARNELWEHWKHSDKFGYCIEDYMTRSRELLNNAQKVAGDHYWGRNGQRGDS